jgi:cyanophycinase
MKQHSNRTAARWNRNLAVLACCLAASACFAQEKRAEKHAGALVLVGGGANRPMYMNRFRELAGGEKAKIVVIPTTLPDDRLSPEGMERLRAQSLDSFGPATVMLHTRDRKIADSAEFVQPLRDATGVWIMGGSEIMLADAYVGTRVEKEIAALFARGGVVAGTSAGAIIQGSVMILGKLVKQGDPDQVSILGTRSAFDLLPQSVIVPHWSQRKLNFNLLAGEHAKEPARLGLGIDEDTAVIVQEGRFEVLGDHHVGIYDGSEHDGKPYLLLSPGQIYDRKKHMLVKGS